MSGVSKGVEGGDGFESRRLQGREPLAGGQSPINDEAADESSEQLGREFTDTPPDELGWEMIEWAASQP